MCYLHIYLCISRCVLGGAVTSCCEGEYVPSFVQGESSDVCHLYTPVCANIIGVLCGCAQLHVRHLCVLSVHRCVCAQVCVWGGALPNLREPVSGWRVCSPLLPSCPSDILVECLLAA